MDIESAKLFSWCYWVSLDQLKTIFSAKITVIEETLKLKSMNLQ